MTTHTLTLTVYDTSASAIASVGVTVKDQTGTTTVTTGTTNGSGVLALTLTDASYLLYFAKTGYVTLSAQAVTVSADAATAYILQTAATVTNGYCTLAEFKNDKRITSSDVTDDSVISDIITDASRLIDRSTGRFYFASTETRYYDRPDDGTLWLDEDLLSVTTLTNGDGDAIASTDYVLNPYSGPSYYAVALRPGQGALWLQSSTYGDDLKAISVLGAWGFVDRTATDRESSERIRNTRSACIDISVWEYLKRFGQNTEVIAQITAGGIVQVPTGEMPKSAWTKIKNYVKA